MNEPDHVADVQRRARELAAPGAFARLRAEHEALVTHWRRYTGGSTLHRPEPFLAERRGRNPGWWIDEETAARIDPLEVVRCGFDAAGRIVIASGEALGGGDEVHLLREEGEDKELITLGWNDDTVREVRVTHLHRDAKGRIASAVEGSGRKQDYHYDRDGRLVLVERFGADAPTPAALETFSYAGDELETVVSTSEWGRRTIWDAARDARVEHLPSLLEISARLGTGLTRAYERAIAAAAAELPDPVFVVLRLVDYAFPPPGAVLDASSLTEAEGSLTAPLDHALVQGLSETSKRKLDPIHHADRETQRLIRSFCQRTDSSAGDAADRADRRPTHKQIVVEVLRALNGRDSRLPVVLWAAGDVDWFPTASDLGLDDEPRRPLDDERWLATIATAGPAAAVAIRERLAQARTER